VRTAFCAACRRADAGRRRAELVAWRDKAFVEAASRPSRFNACLTARDRRGELARVDRFPARLAYAALFFVRGLADAGGACSFTPERRAFDKPIAIACFVDRAPCFPSRTWWISSRTNSPACVVGDFPCRLSFRARSIVAFSGIAFLHEFVTQSRRCKTHSVL